MKKNGSEKYSQTAKDLIRRKALDQGRNRYDSVVQAVTAAMHRIELEIKGNGDVYPSNGGGLTLNELLRRSDVGLKTLFGPKYKEGFKREVVDPWLEKIKTSAVTSRREAAKSAIKRASEWREMYDDLLQSHRKSELDLQEARRRLAEAERHLVTYKRENDELKVALSEATGGKVVRLSKPARP